MPNNPLAPVSVAIDSRLSDDVLLLQGISVQPGLPSQTAVALDDQGNQFYFAILPDIGLVELQFGAGLGSAVTAQALEGGQNATEVVAFCDGSDDQSNGYLHVFWATSNGTQHAYRSAGNDWIGPEQLSTLTGLCISQRAPSTFRSAAILVAGLGGDGKLSVLLPTAWYDPSRSPGPHYIGLSLAQLGSLAGADFAAASPGPCIWLFATDGSGGIKYINLEETDPVGWTSIDTGGVLVDRLLGAQCFQSNTELASILAFIDQDGGLYAAIVDQAGKMSGLGTISAAAGISCGSIRTWVGGACRVYGVSEDGALYVAQLTGLSGGNVPIFTGFLPLDSDVTSASGAYPRIGATIGSLNLLATRSDGSLDLMNQDATSGLWTRLPINQSAASIPLQIEQYRTRVEVTDANGLPCPGVLLTVTPSSPLAFEVAGQFVASAPGQPASLVTDAMGVVEICQPASGLSSVTFTIAVSGLGVVEQVTPHGYITALLAAHAGSEIYTGSAQISLMSGPTLLGATVDGQPLAPSLADATAYPDPHTAAASFATWINLMAAPAGSDGSAGFTLDLTTSGGPTLTQHATSDAVQAHLQLLRRRLLGSIWSDIEGIAGDIWHAIKHAAVEVVTVTVDTVNAMATFVVKIGDELVTLRGLALAGIHEVASTIHGVFATIGADVDKVVDWLKDLFNWSHIWDTMEVFDGYVSSSLSQIASSIPTAQSAASGFFATLKSDVDSTLKQAEADLGATTISGAASEASAWRTRLLGGASLPPPVVLAGSSAQRNWLMSKIQTHFTDSSYLPAYDGGNITSLFTDFSNALSATTILADLQSAASDLQAFLQQLVNPHDLWNAVAVDFLDALRAMIDVVLDVGNAIVETALALAAEIVNAMQALLTKPLPDIPLISWLWENVLRPAGKSDALTLGALFCLAIAVPPTLIAEITTGTNPFLSAPSLDLASAQSDALTILCPCLCAIDIVNDCLNGTTETPNLYSCGVNIFDLLMNLTVQGLSYPGDNVPSIAKLPWGICFVPLAVDVAACVFSISQAAGRELPKNTSNIVTLTDTAAGVIAIVVGLCAVDASPTKQVSDWLDAGFGPAPWATQFLTLPSIVEGSEGGSLLGQSVLDAVGDVGSLIWDPTAS